jgi:hypothetical protein
LCCAWAFSIALDSTTHQSTLYLDVHFQIFMPTFYNIVNLHAVALPMFDWHTGEVMFQMVVSFLDVLHPSWKVHLLGVSSDGAHNMTSRVFGVVTRLSNAMHNECPLTRVLVWNASIRSRYGTHHGHHREGALFYCHDQIYHPLDTAAKSNRGYEDNVPSCRQSLAIRGEGH